MHFAPERDAWAAEAPSFQVPVHSHRISSELIYAGDDHMAMISERRSMPCLRLSTPKSFKRDQSRRNAFALERPASPASTVSSRRSVSSMKQLLPLRLQPTPSRPKIDLVSWLDNTASDMQSPITFDFKDESREDLAEASPIPWMSSLQDVRLSHNHPPNRYRETLIYSNPKSPMLSQAYFGDEGSCHHCSPTGSVCDDLCIVSDYQDARAPICYSQASVVDDADTFDMDKIGSTETSTISFASSRTSTLSTRCRGEYVLPDETSWMKSTSSPWVENEGPETASSSGIDEIEQEQNPFKGWLDGESSRSISSLSNDEVLDALATKLAPAKAHVVELSKVLRTLPNLTHPPKSPLQGRPATPYRLSRRRRTVVNYPLLTMKKSFEDGTVRQRQHQVAPPSSSVVFDLEWGHAMHSPPSSPITRTTFGNDEERFLGYQHGNTESNSIETSKSIIESIYDIVLGFPQHMLFLETPCVVEVRRQNHLRTAARRLSIPSPNSSIYSLPLDQLQRPSYQRRTAAKLFTPFLRASLGKKFLPQDKVASSYVTPSPPRRPTDSRRLSLSGLPPPDLSAFRHIFPSTQDWWRTVLYAHLVAYNYICATQVISQHPVSEVPLKASRTLGISQGYSGHSMASPVSDARLDEIEIGLVSCITWITNCMEGKGNSQTDTKKDQNGYEGNHILVRTLAEIVKKSERGGRTGVQESEFHRKVSF